MGVLGAEGIKRRLEEIFEAGTYNENCIDIASYNLRLDDEELIIDGNKYHKDNKYPYDRMGGVIILPARKISVISTIETLKLSDDLCGNCGITFSLSRKGRVALFGPQIDPGYNDKFYAVIYKSLQSLLLFF
jgi:deoxycytidine triphosphate deaminase